MCIYAGRGRKPHRRVDHFARRGYFMIRDYVAILPPELQMKKLKKKLVQSANANLPIRLYQNYILLYVFDVGLMRYNDTVLESKVV